jgi:lysophospholipase L1-like esterase
MIADVKAKGATPLVLSLTARDIWKEGKIERGSGDYRAWDRALAKTASVEFIALSRIAGDKLQARGEEKTKALFSPDHTHANTAGADFQAAGVVAGLKGVCKGPFGAFLSAKGSAVEADTLSWLNLPEPANPALPSLVLIGDSTVRNGSGDGADGQWGWGDSLGNFFDLKKPTSSIARLAVSAAARS